MEVKDEEQTSRFCITCNESFLEVLYYPQRECLGYSVPPSAPFLYFEVLRFYLEQRAYTGWWLIRNFELLPPKKIKTVLKHVSPSVAASHLL